MKPWLKKLLLGVTACLGLGALGAGGFVYSQTSAFDESMAKVHDVAPLELRASTDPAVVARGKHLAEALAGCSSNDCHGSDLSGGKTLEMGPLGTFSGPNITPNGILAAYSDGELARLLRHGIRKDGRSAVFMPSQDFSWLPDDELAALISYLRTVPAVDKPNGPLELGVLAKVLDRQGLLTVDVARKVMSLGSERAGPPAPTAEYGRFVARICTGCHGDGLRGGPIPGAPPEFPTPSNLTRHETGLSSWSYEDFERLLDEGVRKSGAKLDPFMPIDNFKLMNETEKRALWAYLESLPPEPLGGR
jgi:mono/diheme cytochrome c family protein